jgi:hypothetical protein
MMGDAADGGSFGDFLKAIGNSIAHPQKKSQSRTKSTKQPASKHTASPKPTLGPSPGPPDEGNVRSTKQSASKHTASPKPTVGPSPGPPDEGNVHTASAAPEAKPGKADVPYAIPVPGKQGFVTSPFAPESGYIDVHQFAPGTAVKDPFTGKVFLTP